jgi:hypothetical protein
MDHFSLSFIIIHTIAAVSGSPRSGQSVLTAWFSPSGAGVACDLPL